MRTKYLIAPLVALVAAVGCMPFGGDPEPDLLWVHVESGKWHRGASPAEIAFDGRVGDVPVPADYDGDGRPEIAVVRAGKWITADGTELADFPAPEAGARADAAFAEPVPADYDGDGRAEPAWFRNSDATWWIHGEGSVPFGKPPTLPATARVDRACQIDQDLPVPADYDGDKRADLSTYSPRTGAWTVQSSATGKVSTATPRPPDGTLQFPVPADYNGDGRAERALFAPSGWLIEGSAAAEPLDPRPANPENVVLPAIADLDGDGDLDRSYVEVGPQESAWRFAGSARVLTLPGTPGPGVPAAANQRLLFNIGRFTIVGQNLRVLCYDPAWAGGSDEPEDWADPGFRPPGPPSGGGAIDVADRSPRSATPHPAL